MKIVQFLNAVGLGGTEKASSIWSEYLRDKGHDVTLLYLEDGAGKSRFTDLGLALHKASDATEIRAVMETLQPDVIHAHAPGFPHPGDILGTALLGMPKRIPVVQTNIFGFLANPNEDAWTHMRLFISWTSCVQAARRHDFRLDAGFFQSASVAVYPLRDEIGTLEAAKIRQFRLDLGFQDGDVVYGKFARPDLTKWSELSIKGFQLALKENSKIKLLLREPPGQVLKDYQKLIAQGQVTVLPMTSDPTELRMTMASVDVVLHSSAIGESFGYGIAEPMQLGKPVIANSIPWRDQAQVELVDHGKGGFLASSPQSTRDCILRLARDPDLRRQMGAHSKKRIGDIAQYEKSGARLQESLLAVTEGRPNPRIDEDTEMANRAAAYLDQHQFGYTCRDAAILRVGYLARRTKRFLWKFRPKTSKK